MNRPPLLVALASLIFAATLAGCGPSVRTPAPVAGEPAVEIRPRVAGYIDRVQFVAGARVRKGEVLFRIDPRPFRAEAERQRAARSRALVELDLAKADRARAQRSVGEKAMSPEEVARLARADSVAASDLATATAALSAAKLNLELTEVRAPIDGRVSRALLTQNTLVSSESLLTTLVADDRGS